jgi:hypothetical protein
MSVPPLDRRCRALLANGITTSTFAIARNFIETLRYIHRNPVKAGLCARPEDWEWSSFRHYATGYEGRVEIESERPLRNAKVSKLRGPNFNAA